MRRRIYRKAHRTLKPPISKQHKAKTKNHKNLPICYAALNSGLHFPLIYAATPQLSLFLSAVSLPRSPPQPPPPWPPIITPKTNPTSTKSSPSASSSSNPSKPNSSPNASLSPPIPSSTSLQKNPNPNPRIFHTHSILIWICFFFFLKDYVAGWDCEGREEVGDIAIGRCERDFEEFGFQRFDFWGQWGSLGHV